MLRAGRQCARGRPCSARRMSSPAFTPPSANRQLGRHLTHGLAECAQAIVGQTSSHARNGNRSQRLAAVIVDHGCDAPKSHAGFLVVDGVTLAADRLKLLEQVAGAHDRFFRQAWHAVVADDRAHVLVRVSRPSTALPTPDATIATRPPSLVSERMISRLSMRVRTTMNSSSTTARLAVSRVGRAVCAGKGWPGWRNCGGEQRSRRPVKLRAPTCHFNSARSNCTKRRFSSVPSRRCTVEVVRPVRIARSLSR